MDALEEQRRSGQERLHHRPGREGQAEDRAALARLHQQQSAMEAGASGRCVEGWHTLSLQRAGP